MMAVGCSRQPVFYMPPSQNVPLLSQEKEFTASSSFLGAEAANGVDVKAAYAAGTHLGLVGGINAYFPDEGAGFFSPGTYSNDSYGKGGRLEAGAGYYKQLSPKVVFESYGLFGYGWLKNDFPESVERHPETDGKIRAHIFSIGAQPAIGFKSTYFEAAFSAKTAFVAYSNIRGSLIETADDGPGESKEQSMQDYLERNKNNFMLEPAFTLRGGLGFLKLQLQFGWGINMTHSNFLQEDRWVSLGLSYRLMR